MPFLLVLFRSDRKSTRLNSSHLVISYAVFCLQKMTRCRRGARRSTTRIDLTPRRRARRRSPSYPRSGRLRLRLLGPPALPLSLFFFLRGHPPKPPPLTRPGPPPGG